MEQNFQFKEVSLQTFLLKLAQIYLRMKKSQELLKKFPDITIPFKYTDTLCHSANHYIKTNRQPTHSTLRRMSPEKNNIAKAEYQHVRTQYNPKVHGHHCYTWY